MTQACAGVRVLDVCQGLAGSLATMILADFGAEVIRVEPSKGDPGWQEPAYLLLQRGKKSIDLDLASPGGRATLRDLVARVDVLVESTPVGSEHELGLNEASLLEANPTLVHCSISGFGRSGPLAHLKADDGLAMAKCGVFRGQPGWHADNRPVFRASRDASYFAGMLAVQGILGALRVRDLTGEGQRVDTSFLQALTCRQNPNVRWLLREGEQVPDEARHADAEVQSTKHVLPHHMDPRRVNLIGMRVQCKDGRWLVHSHTEPHFFPAWIEVLDLAWIWADDRFKGAPYSFASPEDHDALLEIVRQRMAEKTSDEWMALYVANGNVCGDVIQTTQDALRHPQVRGAELVVEIEDPRVGPTVQVGPLARFGDGSPVPTIAAPVPGEHTAGVLAGLDEQRDDARTAPSSLRLPLEGITILEAAYYYATPFATSLLSELGARVIKIEPLRGDPYRALARAGVGDPVQNLGHNNMVRAMQGKESIAVDLKDPAGQEILRRLVAKCDVFVHSFRLGVPESLGIDEASLRAINPRLMYQFGASYGSTGPYARQPAIDPVIAAFVGTTAHQAGEGNLPLTETGADPVAAAGHATAMMLGLFARHRTGEAVHVESSMVVSNLFLNCEDAIAYDGKPPRRPVDRLQLGTGATYRLYETAPLEDVTSLPPYENPDQRWVFLSVEEDEEFERFCGVAGCTDLAHDPRFASKAARREHDEELAATMEALFLQRSAKDWENASVAAGVGCLVADAATHFAFLHHDPQAAAAEMVSPSEHASFGGTYWRYSPVIRFSKTPGVAGAFCELGEHTRRILDELGYSAEETSDLEARGVVGSLEQTNPATTGS
jgi:crotonobetainyl-CoA:carnitine CoA-transferase CaiB-like acyl-CoA transferase